MTVFLNLMYKMRILKVMLQKSCLDLKAVFTIKRMPLCKRQNAYDYLQRVSEGLKELRMFTTISILYSSEREKFGFDSSF